MVKTAIYRIATLTSLLGHPLLVLSVFTIVFSFRLYDAILASVISTLIIGIVVVPVTIRNYLKARRNEYTNFDVSDRKQRENFYPFAIALLCGITLILYFIPGADHFFRGTLVTLLMIITAALVNLKIKCSLHTAVSIFITIVLIDFGVAAALSMGMFALMIAMSRIYLQRHSWIEIISGGCIGIIFGVFSLIVQ
jgi:hypothetical protein